MRTLDIRCAACRSPLDSKVDTDGNGELVVFVRGCLRCTGLIRLVRHRVRPKKQRSRHADGPRKGGYNSPKPKRNERGELLCVVCGTVLQQGKGRPPTYCAVHRNPANRPAKVEAVA